VSTAKPATGPTNGRPWPGDRIRVTRSGAAGTVCDYEWGWNSTLFPVKLDGACTERIFTAAEVTTIRSTVVYLPGQAATPAATPAAGFARPAAGQPTGPRRAGVS
jgi:hypothetical protein